MMQSAPFFSDMAEGPDGGAAYWITAKDGVRLRLGVWPGQSEGITGTVYLFPGRTEYVEKYGKTSLDLSRAGLHVAVIDWRGQGLADRVASDPILGHVHDFADYQLDVSAMIEAAEALDLPKPWFLLGHSMGGCIGLRSLMDGMPVEAAAFSAPMWGIHMSPHIRPFAWALSWASRYLGFDQRYAPGTLPEAYVLSEPFETNRLTTDTQMYDYMIRHVVEQPELRVGGPSLRWLYEGLAETRALSNMASPNVPCLVLLGTDEDIVDPARIHDRVARWPSAILDLAEGARHEVLMEETGTRTRADACVTKFFANYQSITACEPQATSAAPDAQSQAPSHRLRTGNA
ncbi:MULTISPECIES: alpha/beta hydrolase [Roseovarius]|uniref:Alpha/beta hydrolase n=2 Tax=Roseovarius TaxID=74030 RepID=A0ABZ2HIR0_9RHOB|nr:alpha/beta hydrolase [Roseovarius sp. W115]MDV2929168.1 alpha/beta hydrolase [Roseovarius sp. W115]